MNVDPLLDGGAWLLRRLDPEVAHRAAMRLAQAGLLIGPGAFADPVLRTNVAGLDLVNPIGLAAGFDKNASGLMGLQRLGFGFIEAGTVTPRPQPGNPRPRLFRLEQDLAIINRMGFNNAGLDAFVRRLQALRLHVPVGANVGANKDSADRIADFVEGLHRVWPHADYVSINVSSPNTPGLRGLQEPGQLQDLLGRLAEARAIRLDEHGDRPVFLKVAPDLDEAAIAAIAELSLANGVSGLIVSNTTLERPDSLSSAARGESGGLSGRPLFVRSTTVLRAFAQCLGGRLPLIGVGGVEDGKTALEKIKAGASAVQIYSALIYGGPGLPRKIAKDLAARLKAEGFGAVKDAVGAG